MSAAVTKLIPCFHSVDHSFLFCPHASDRTGEKVAFLWLEFLKPFLACEMVRRSGFYGLRSGEKVVFLMA